MKINPFVPGALTLIVFLGIIFGFQQAGVWSTSGKVDKSGNRVQPSAADVTSLKGWMTLEQVSTTYSIPIGEILSAFNLPADTAPGTALKDLESASFSVSNLRSWIQERNQTTP